MEKNTKVDASIKTESGYVDTQDGARIYYESHGEGPVIMLTYGIGCLLNHWRYQVEHFSKTHRVISYDLRGHHQSSAPENRDHVTIERMGTDLLTLADKLNVDKFSAWGHSFGVPVVMEAYKQDPSKIDSLVLVNGFSHNPFEGKIDKKILNNMHKRTLMYRKYVPGVLDFIWQKATSGPFTAKAVVLAGGFNGKLTPQEDIDVYIRGLQALDVDVYGRCFNDMVNWDGRGILDKIEVPTLVVAGKKDRISPLNRQTDLHKNIPNSEFRTFAQGTHCTQLDVRDEVNAEAEEFLKKVRGAA